MFEKLLAMLPYSPGMAHQMAFYARRMREEATIRRTGLVFIVLAFMVQFFAVLSPPQSTNAASNNDLVNGGFSSASEAARDCRNNIQQYGTILDNYNISCKEVANAPTITLSSTDYNRQLYSMGRLPYGLAGETPVNINGHTYYMRYLWSWDTHGPSQYKALKITARDGKTYFLLYTCGNLVSIRLPQPVPACQYNNNILANSPKCVKPCQYDQSIAASSPQCFKPCQYDKSVPANSPKCVAPCPLPGKGNLPQNSPQCVAACPYNKSLPANSPKCFKPCQYNKAVPASSPQCFKPCQYNKSIPASSPQCFKPCQYNNNVAANSPNCKPCSKSSSSQDKIACVAVHKTASNLTNQTANADGTTANPGDTIRYTLYAKNNGKAAVKNFVFQESLSDVMDYAEPVSLHGGKLSTDDVVSWKGVNIAAGKTVTKEIDVKVKDPVPATPADPGDPGHFDLTMTNVYGNTINIHLPSPPTKTMQNVAGTLPNTGPGTGLIISGAITVVAGYFFARARLLAREGELAVKETVGA